MLNVQAKVHQRNWKTCTFEWCPPMEHFVRPNGVVLQHVYFFVFSEYLNEPVYEQIMTQF